MKLPRSAYVVVTLLAAAFATPALAQLTPGEPDGILPPQTFQLKQHPQMEFAASAPSGKYQTKVTAARRKADLGDPNGCNLQCPPSSDDSGSGD